MAASPEDALRSCNRAATARVESHGRPSGWLDIPGDTLHHRWVSQRPPVCLLATTCIACSSAPSDAPAPSVADKRPAAAVPREVTPPSLPHEVDRPASSSLQRSPLRFLQAWKPEWRLALKVDELVELAGLERGLLLYVEKPGLSSRRVPHVLADGHLRVVAGMDSLATERHDPDWRESYGRWPEALWRMVERDDEASEIQRWDRHRWRPARRFEAACDASLVGHSWDGALLVATKGCTGDQSRPYALDILRSDGSTHIGITFAEIPFFGLITADALYVITSSVVSKPDSLHRFVCAMPYDCPPEEILLDGVPGIWPWLDAAWGRQWGGLALRDGIALVHQREGEDVEAHLVTHFDGVWRDVPAPGRITALLGVADGLAVVMQAPIDDRLLLPVFQGWWPDSKPMPFGDTVWLHNRTNAAWRPVRLPEELNVDQGVQIAADTETLWLAAPAYSRSKIYATPLAGLPLPKVPPSMP